MLKLMILGLASLGLSFSAPAGAAIVLDQDALIQPVSGAGTQIVSPARRLIAGQLRDIRYVQTATAGQGGILSGIELQGYKGFNQPADTLRLTLIDGDYAAGARTAVGSRDLNAAQAPAFLASRNLEAFVTFDTSSFAYRVATGQMFSVLIELIPLNQTGSFTFTTANTFGQVQNPDGSFGTLSVGANYARGGLYQLSATGIPIALQHDIGFRSYVDVSGAVPEPTTWAMLILGFGLTGAAMRRRREPALA